MGVLDQKTQVEIVPISGVLRVTIASEPNFAGAAVQAVSTTLFFWLGARSFLNLPRHLARSHRYRCSECGRGNLSDGPAFARID